MYSQHIAMHEICWFKVVKLLTVRRVREDDFFLAARTEKHVLNVYLEYYHH